MYATAFQTSAIARAYINKLVDEPKLQTNDRQALQELSFDIVNFVSTLRQVNHPADVNAADNLRKIIKRLPDDMIGKWKATVADMREKGETPSLEHISQFFRRRFRAEFGPDFGDIPKLEHRRSGIHFSQRDGRKKPLQCYVCPKPSCNRMSNACQRFQRRENPARQRSTTMLFMSQPRPRNQGLKIEAKCEVNGCS